MHLTLTSAQWKAEASSSLRCCFHLTAMSHSPCLLALPLALKGRKLMQMKIILLCTATVGNCTEQIDYANAHY